MEKFIKGEYKQTLFSSDDGFTISRVKVKDTNDEHANQYLGKSLIITGYYPVLQKDESYNFFGDFVVHKKYGEQYKIKKYEFIRPQGKDGIIQYLSSGLFPGIGEKTASTIVEYLGDDSVNKILEDPNNLLIVPKMTQKKALRLHETLKDYEGSQKAILYLTELGFGLKLAMKIYKKYDYQTTSIIESNPYKLIEDIEGVGFIKIDEIAYKLNIQSNDERRIKAALIYTIIKECMNEGHTYLTKDQLINLTLKLLRDFSISDNMIEKELSELIELDKIIEEDNRYYHPTLLIAENEVVQILKELNNIDYKDIGNFKHFNKYIDNFEKDNDVIYNDKQIDAIRNSLSSPIFILTGGPGTGKTTTINGIVDIYSKIHKIDPHSRELLNKIALVAPTGRAAKRMSYYTKLPASTIHRFLVWDKSNDTFKFNEDNQVNVDLLIIDETSMIDTWLLSNLLKAIPLKTQIIFVGDNHQLPSVQPGEVLKDLLESKLFETIHLDKIYRQSEDSTIAHFAHYIKDGITPDDLTEKKSDRNFINCSKDDVVKLVRSIAENASSKGYSYEDLQVLAPMYRGVAGIDKLNEGLQEVFNPYDPMKRELKFNDRILREGDKILQLVNMPDENVFNGDVGLLEKIKFSKEESDKKNTLYINFDGNIVKYKPNDFINITHAYAMSIHKSQGSEFKIVVMPILSSYKRMLKRKLIYTGITRAKEVLILLGEPDVFINSIKMVESVTRQTTLKNRLIELFTGKKIKIDYVVEEVKDVEINEFTEIGEVGMENLTPYDFM